MLRSHALSWFDRPWPEVPAQAVMYFFIWVAGLHVILLDTGTRLGFEHLRLGEVTYLAWDILILISPIMVLVSWALIFHKRGRWRVVGFWLRLGGDLGVWLALLAYLATRFLVLHGKNIGDSPVFALVILTGMAVLVTTFVVRDIGALILLERVASALHREGG